MEFKPVRKVVHRANIKRVGFFPSDKIGRLVEFESLLERDYFFLIEFDPNVKNFCEQPLEIPYIHKGKSYNYYPDISVERQEQKIEILEVKPQKKLNDPKILRKINAGILYCKSMDYEFRIITEAQIDPIILKNIKMLFGYRRIDFPSKIKMTIREIVGQRREIQIDELAYLLIQKVGQHKKVLAFIYHSLYHHKLDFFIKQPIQLNSLVWLPVIEYSSPGEIYR